MFYFTKEIMKNQGKDCPIDNIHDKEHWRRWITILVQHPIEERLQGAHQNKTNRR
jgi:hypothetical protein